MQEEVKLSNQEGTKLEGKLKEKHKVYVPKDF